METITTSLFQKNERSSFQIISKLMYHLLGFKGKSDKLVIEV